MRSKSNKKIKNAKIIATLGPASTFREIILAMVKSGVNLFRINFSHAKYQEVRNRIRMVRLAEKELGVYIGLIADLQGPKIRIGEVEGVRTYHRDEQVYLINKETSSDKKEIPLPFTPFFENVKEGDYLYINDGLVKLKVVKKITSDKLECVVKTGGIVSTHKGVNLPDTELKSSPLTEKDLQDLEFIKTQPFSYVALSFVQRESDIKELREKLEGTNIGIIAKIEKKNALENIKDIIKVSDGVMVARGDLGIEVAMEKLPYYQRQIISYARFYSKPVIVATQMLESMIQNAIPTRAEVNDIANAVEEGADALMLSGETAMGNYPVEVVEWMSKIIKSVEQEWKEEKLFNWRNLEIEEAISRSAVISAKAVDADYIVATTLTGRTAMLISKLHANYPVIAFSPYEQTLRKTTLFWGTDQILAREVSSLNELVKEVKTNIQKKYKDKRSVIVITGGFPFEYTAETNFILIEKC